jgi:hypothetical protein
MYVYFVKTNTSPFRISTIVTLTKKAVVMSCNSDWQKFCLKFANIFMCSLYKFLRRNDYYASLRDHVETFAIIKRTLMSCSVYCPPTNE